MFIAQVQGPHDMENKLLCVKWELHGKEKQLELHMESHIFFQHSIKNFALPI